MEGVPQPKPANDAKSGWPRRVVWWTLVAASRRVAGVLARRGFHSQQIIETLWPLRLAVERLRCRGTVVVANGAKFLYSSDDLINLKLALVGGHEFDTTRFLHTRLHTSDVFVDVGANLGYFTVLGAKLTPAGRVVAVEPSPRNFAALQTNIALNGLRNVETAQDALWSESGKEVALHVPDPYNRGANSLVSQGAVEAVLTTVTLDDLLRRLGVARMDAIKIDVEGAELEVLAGAQHSLRSLQPHTIVLALDHHDEQNRQQSFGMLIALGYREVDPFTDLPRPARNVLGRTCVFLERT